VNAPERESPTETRTVADRFGLGVVTLGRPGTSGIPIDENVVGFDLGPSRLAPLVAVTT
jgi:hypothetical protein